jgi:hypothetical protein
MYTMLVKINISGVFGKYERHCTLNGLGHEIEFKGLKKIYRPK